MSDEEEVGGGKPTMVVYNIGKNLCRLGMYT